MCSLEITSSGFVKLPEPLTPQKGWPWDSICELMPSTMADGRPWPRVTVVTPSYNQGIFLEEAIRSILLQGYPNLEYIIMDGGSTDESVDIIQRYAPWLSFWISRKDEGQSSAINEGFKRSSGEYVAWLNSDDVFLPHAIQSGIEKIHSMPEVGMAFGQVEVINEKGIRVGVFEQVNYKFDDLLKMKIILPQQAAFFRRSVLDTIGLLRTDLHYAMDVEFFIRIGSHYEIFQVNEILAQFRLSDINKGVASKVNWCPEFIRIIEDFYNSENISESLTKLKSPALGGAYYRGAHTYLEVGQFKQARNWLFQASRHNHQYFLKPGWWKCLVYTCFGKIGNQIINIILTWLQVKGIYINENNWSTGLSAIKYRQNRRAK